MPNLYKSRFSLLILIIFLYLGPILLLSSYGRLYMPSQNGWNLLAFGILCSSLGTLVLFWIMCRSCSTVENQNETIKENDENDPHETLNSVNNLVPMDASNKALEELQSHNSVMQEQLMQTQAELEAKNDELQRLQHEYQVLQQQFEKSSTENDEHHHIMQRELDQQKKLIADSQKTITEQRESIDKKLQQIGLLESKVSDLTYEIKTLIQLAEIENQSMPLLPSQPAEYSLQSSSSIGLSDDDMPFFPEKQVRNQAQAAIQLKRCIDIAQKITGASYYNNSNSRFKDLSIDNYTLDLRRLFESLRMENASTVFFYSQKESKVLFVNNQSRNLLGWSPDKFVQSFYDIIEPSKEIWKQGITSLAIKNDVQVSLKMKSKAGSSTDVQVHLGIIPTGLFKHHILGIIYASSQN